MEISEFQKLMSEIYLAKDQARGIWGTYGWMLEEMGELSRALRKGEREALYEEFADVLAWLTSLANLTGVDLEEAVGKYKRDCPKCHETPCACREKGSGERA